jgi:hypothetical protein
MAVNRNVTEHVAWCEANKRIVILDLTVQRYYCLPAALEEDFRNVAAGQLVPKDQYQRLLALLPPPSVQLADLDRVRPVSRGNRPLSDIEKLPAAEGHAFDLASAIFAQFKASMELRYVAFSRIVHRICDRQKSIAAIPARRRDYQMAIATFISARRILKSNDRCLMHSIAMVDFLASRGIPSTLVVGVRMSPWGAHAWVQDGDMVLNDSVDRVAAYTPILTI